MFPVVLITDLVNSSVVGSQQPSQSLPVLTCPLTFKNYVAIENK